jgi:uncharacterized protein
MGIGSTDTMLGACRWPHCEVCDRAVGNREMVSEEFKPTERTRVKRFAKYANYDRNVVYSIIDRALICHVGFITDAVPHIIPTLHVRIADDLYLHGASSNQMLRAAAAGNEICVAITHVDGIVLARSALYHTMNYRSAVIFGRASAVETDRKPEVLRALVEHVVPGRWSSTRRPSNDELATTLIIALPLNEASAKIRTGDPNDAEQDYKLRHWAGVIPLRLQADPPIADAKLDASIALPEHVRAYRPPDSRGPIDP